MTTKYVCLADGCNFVSEIEEEAQTHAEKAGEHRVVEVIPVNDAVDCSILGDTGEDMEDEEIDEEEMTAEEEEE